MSNFKKVALEDITVNLDKIRVPLSSSERSKLAKIYPYYGAQSIVDYVDDYLFDGEYLLVAEDGENLKSQNANVCNFVTGKFWVNNHAHILQTKNGNSLKYLYYLLNLRDFRPYVTGSAQPKLTQDNLNKIEVLIHEPDEQHKIATVLSSLDSKIELNNHINAELEAMAKTLYDYWFVQFNFPFDFAKGKPDPKGKPYKTSRGKMVRNEELKREIPEGWKVVKMSELYDFQYGFGNINPDNGGQYPVYGSNGVIGSYDRFNNEDAPVIGHIGNNCGSLVFAEGKHYVTYNGVMCKIKNGFDKYFGYAVLLSKDLKSHTRGSSQQFISYDMLYSLDVVIPDVSIMIKYCDIVNPLFDSLIINKKENQQLAELRDWLLPMLMNGQVTVGDSAENKTSYKIEEEMRMAAEPGVKNGPKKEKI